jgi:hypothetical protein
VNNDVRGDFTGVFPSCLPAGLMWSSGTTRPARPHTASVPAPAVPRLPGVSATKNTAAVGPGSRAFPTTGSQRLKRPERSFLLTATDAIS